jgi:5-oxoprolinase (ATP-hydrolysing) subunit A
MKGKIDFNCDMGESFGVYKLGHDEAIITHITSANIACGFHAGDPLWMRKTVRMAEEWGVGIGAHPSFPDLRGFGRRNLAASPDEVRSDVMYQIGALAAFTRDHRLQHVKPHGAMYNMAANDDQLARAICEAVLEVDPEMILLVLANSRMENVASEMGIRIAREVFADRALNRDGTLVPRTKAGAVIHDIEQVIERSVRMIVSGKASAITGEEIDIAADTLCLHGDTPGAVELAAALKARLESEGVELVPLAQLV